MKLQKNIQALLLFLLGITLVLCQDDEEDTVCNDFTEEGGSDDLVFYEHLSEDDVKKWRRKSRVCLPDPCSNLKAYSGFIHIAPNQFLFFLHFKAKEMPQDKPLLLWLQGGPGKSSLHAQFLENGPLGINASGQLFHREHTLLNQFNLLYLDQPVGAGYSFGQRFPGNSVDVIFFLKRFLRVFREYQHKQIYVAGESYGARFALGVAHKILNKYDDKLFLELGGVMLGAGFLFPLMEIINSAEYLRHSSLLDERGCKNFSAAFAMINKLIAEKNYQEAVGVLSNTVLNLRKPGDKSLFQLLTGFDVQASIAYPKRPIESYAYFRYANSSGFKKRIHVSTMRSLDGNRLKLSMRLAMQDFFVDITKRLEDVLDMSLVLFYTAQFDDVFPTLNLEHQLRKLSWRSSAKYKRACRLFWRHKDDPSGPLLGYEKRVPGLLSATVLFGGHYIYQDRSEAVSELYRKFLKFPRVTVVDDSHADNEECYMMKSVGGP